MVLNLKTLILTNVHFKRNVYLFICSFIHSAPDRGVQGVFWLHTEALAQIGLFVDEHFGRHNISKRHEHLQNVLVPELLRQVIDEKVCPFWSCKHNTQHKHTLNFSGEEASCLTLSNSMSEAAVFWLEEEHQTASLW